ncbi:MAG: hypothetical protein Hyperionvirus3_120 [Hyperionvirus sp.]|uniref:Uncharacterized protein n=1 Tax=Hyperionvirus sp. TaxID=2487770 RepID=A0A3G5A910_9VIRU|nr:MAG: hypothetical protein Hyperionvirus3_120 [Hyperionvirus sp.]
MSDISTFTSTAISNDIANEILENINNQTYERVYPKNIKKYLEKEHHHKTFSRLSIWNLLYNNGYIKRYKKGKGTYAVLDKKNNF